MPFRTVIPVVLLITLQVGCTRDPQVLKQRFLEMGNKYYARGRYEEASLLYRKALQQDGRFAAAYHGLGKAEQNRGNYSAAAAAYIRSFELNPTDLEAFEQVAEWELVLAVQPGAPKRRLQQLIDLVEKAEAQNPGTFEVTRVKGLLLRVQGDLDEAIQLFQQALALRPGEPRTVLSLAESLLAAGKNAEFEQTARAAVKRNPAFVQMYDLLYVHYYREGRLNEAESILKAKAEANPDDAVSQLSLAGHYWRNGQIGVMNQVLNQRLFARPEMFPNAHELVGDFFMGVGQGSRAIEQYKAGLAAHPDSKHSKELNYKVVVAMTANGQWKEAAALVDRMLVQDPDDAQAISLRGALRLYSGDRRQMAAAVTDFENVMRKAPTNPVLRHRLGEAYMRNGDLHNARIQFNEAIKLDPDYLAPKHELMKLYLARRELGPTVVLTEEVLSKYPNDPEAILVHAVAKIALGEYDKPRAALEGLIQRNQFVAQATVELARLDIRQRQIGRAETRLREAASESPGNDVFQRGLAEIYAASGRLEQAMQVLTQRVERNPKNPTMRFDLARFTARLGHTEEAIAQLKQIVAGQPDHVPSRVLLGELLLSEGKENEAREQFQAVAGGDHPSPDALVHLGLLLAKKRDYRGARPYFERALSINPDHAVGQNNLAYILAESDIDLDAALTHAQRAMALQPDEPEFADTLGLVYVKRGLYDSAVNVLSALVEKFPEKASFRYHYGMALAGNGKTDQARAELRQSLRSRPTAAEQQQIEQLLAKMGGGTSSAVRPSAPLAAEAKAVAPAAERSPAEKAPRPTAPASYFQTPKPGQRFLQVAALDRGRAEVFAEAIIHKGFSVQVAEGPDGRSFRVLVGPIADDKQLIAVRERLESEGFQPFLRKY